MAEYVSAWRAERDLQLRGLKPVNPLHGSHAGLA